MILLAFSLTASAAGDTGDGDPEEESEAATVQAATSSLFQPGVLLQSIASLESEAPDGNNGFTLAKARVNVIGQVEGGWDYLVQTDFASSLSLLDARIRYGSNARLGITTGMYKVPFSREWLTSAAKIDFVKRSQVVSALSPKRDVGLTVRATPGNAFKLRAGIFNGNGRSLTGNDNNRLLYVTRIEYAPGQPTNLLTTGVNLSYNQAGKTPDDHRQLLVGADLRTTLQSFLISAEAIYAEQTHSTTADIRSFGYHVTAGYTLSTELFQQVLLRLDRYSPDVEADALTLIVAGYNINPVDVVGVQLNYVFPTHNRPFDHHQLLMDLQFAW